MAGRQAGAAQLSSNLSGAGCCWKGKDCFMSPDESKCCGSCQLFAGSSLLLVLERVEQQRRWLPPCSPAWLPFLGIQLKAAHCIALSRLLHLSDIPSLPFPFSDLPFVLFWCTGPPSITFTFLKHKKRHHTALVSNVSHCRRQNFLPLNQEKG